MKTRLIRVLSHLTRAAELVQQTDLPRDVREEIGLMLDFVREHAEGKEQSHESLDASS